MGFAAVAIFSLLSYSENRKAANKQDAASRQRAAAERNTLKAQQRIADIKAGRERRKAAQEARKNRARVVAQSEVTGTSGSSGVQGALGSSQTIFSSNVATAGQISQVSQQASIFNIAASESAQDSISSAVGNQNRADLYGTASSIFGSKA